MELSKLSMDCWKLMGDWLRDGSGSLSSFLQNLSQLPKLHVIARFMMLYALSLYRIQGHLRPSNASRSSKSMTIVPMRLFAACCIITRYLIGTVLNALPLEASSPRRTSSCHTSRRR